jgi:endonuclease YncB( thermonuclease family)
LPPGTKVRIEQDPALDQVDRYDRQLAYVWKADEDINLTLVEDGAAGVWFFDGDRGRYARRLLRAAEQARADQKGLWGACPLATFDPTNSLATGPPQ